jgi:acyl carrier protein
MPQKPASVRSLLAEQLSLPAEAVSPDLAINEAAEWDSLAHLDLMFYLEQTFGIEVNEAAIIQCASVAGLVELLGLPLEDPGGPGA